MILNDGETMKINIDAQGKKKVKFSIDGSTFEIDLMREKVSQEMPKIP